ncbi:mandelate racemase/muconate lactonizing enzyme family protein [Paenibacillus psychroresistens]|uniref:Mandelate racemase/muconate lactonizing enzyme family protein n=1 Tax=Paenibacillus psychroresistens TaxID=1778678 RepID=A0A6B8RI64_9BACL|nr:mandelate racemase/muconate lactonizing enzyme family protein [Paenibacillus psychroresistens]QGQ95577.1 mandelate racemase/muconate lactonizing enzyme family protein [Paenibacillus psychroresistens]
MKITDVRTVLLTGPCTNDPFLSEARKRRSAAFIEIITDTELVGIGETYIGYFFPESVPGIVDFFKPILIGQSVDNIAELWRRMYHAGNFWCRTGMGISVLNGIEAALWDLKGKMTGLPVYELLGGRKHDRLPCYATGGPSNYPKEKLAAKLDHYLKLGFKGVKLGVGCLDLSNKGWHMPRAKQEIAEFEADKLAFVRSHIGKDIQIMLDGHMGNSWFNTWDLDTATTVLQALEPYDLLFFEEPLHYTDAAGYAELCRRTTIPIAGGECLTGSAEWKMFTDLSCFDIGQPDASFTGGLGEFMKVAAMLEARGRKIATHAWGAGGCLMQNIHCAFACGNTLIVEIPPDYAGLHSDIVRDSFRMENGDVLPPEQAGLGIVLTDNVKMKYPFIPGSGEFNSVPGKILTD